MSAPWVLLRRLLPQPSSSFGAFSSSSFSQHPRRLRGHHPRPHCRRPSLHGPRRLWACRRPVLRRWLAYCWCRPLYAVSGYNAREEAAESRTLQVGDFVRYLGRHVDRGDRSVLVSWTILKFTSLSNRPANRRRWAVAHAFGRLATARPCLS